LITWSKSIHFKITYSLKKKKRKQNSNKIFIFFLNTVNSDIKTNEPIKPPSIVNGWVDAICVRNNCIDANNNKPTRSDIRNDVACEAAKKIK
jgi:hypothetical protein